MKKILWLTTGGTIASGPSANGLTPQLKGDELLYLLPELEQIGAITCLDILNIDSSNLTPQHWLLMANTIKEHYHNYDGFVISHGTDTLTWTSAALKLMLKNLNKPIALVASQLTFGEANSDAPANLIAAFTVARDGSPDVYLVCSGFVFPALWVNKVASENLDCFRPTNQEPVATYDLTYKKQCITPLFWLDKLPSPTLNETSNLTLAPLDLNKKIAHITLTPFIDKDFIEALANYDGFIVEAYGAGGIPSIAHNNLVEALSELIANNKPVVCISQCLYDGVTMDRYAVGREALASGIISGGKLNREAANLLLLICLSSDLNHEAIAAAFAKYN